MYVDKEVIATPNKHKRLLGREFQMIERLRPLIQNAVLNIVEFDFHTKSELNTIARTTSFYVMSYLKCGEALVRIDGIEYIAKPGSIVLLPPYKPHDHIKTSKEDAVFLWWHFNFITSGKVDILSLLKLPVVTYMTNTSVFESTFLQYMDAINREESIPALVYRNAKAMEVLACLFEGIMSSGNAQLNPDVPKVFYDILEDITGAPHVNLSLSLIAEKYHMNATYISNRFKSYFGISPIFLHRELLVEKAKQLLVSGHLSIGEVSGKLGFSDLGTFTRFFSEKAGVSPTKYRNNIAIN
jgi:AraC family transcriptional regulator, arabinose operon regulatory protein